MLYIITASLVYITVDELMQFIRRLFAYWNDIKSLTIYKTETATSTGTSQIKHNRMVCFTASLHRPHSSLLLAVLTYLRHSIDLIPASLHRPHSSLLLAVLMADLRHF